MTRKWKAGGKELYDDQVPFAPGTDQYYRYIAEWRAKSLGMDLYGAPDKLDSQENWDKALEEKRSAWFNETKAQDRGFSGQQAAGYAYGTDRTTGASTQYYDMNKNGVFDPTENAGKYQNPAARSDNSWNELDGVDPRTDEQKFYNRDMSEFEQIADANGTYNWYGDWEYRNGQGATEKKRLNLTYLGDRDGRDAAGNDIVGSGLDYARDKETANFGGHDYSKYNGAPEKSWFDDQVRQRKNMSIYARTA